MSAVDGRRSAVAVGGRRGQSALGGRRLAVGWASLLWAVGAGGHAAIGWWRTSGLQIYKKINLKFMSVTF